MNRYERHIKFSAAGLSALAGFVDATGFLSLGGYFVSFMSGNTTRFAVGVAEHTAAAAIAGGLIATFVVGVILGSLTGHAAKGKNRAPVILLLVAILLALAATLGLLGFNALAAGAMALAMGAENAVFEREGEVHIGLTYMTGTLVKLGQRIALALTGGDPLAWWPYFLLWLGLAAGAVAGALIYPYMGLNSLWLAAGAAATFALVIWRSGWDFGPQSLK